MYLMTDLKLPTLLAGSFSLFATIITIIIIILFSTSIMMMMMMMILGGCAGQEIVFIT